MNKVYVAFLTCVVIGISFLFIPLKQVFSFEQTRTADGEVLYIPLNLEEPAFSFVYTHSIHLSDVSEFYEVTDDVRIRSLAMEYEDVAIGMPGYAEQGQTLTIQDGKYRLTFDDEVSDGFTIYLSNISSKQTFVYQNTVYDLKAILKKGSSYSFSLKKISIFQWWKGGVYKYDKKSDTN